MCLWWDVVITASFTMKIRKRCPVRTMFWCTTSLCSHQIEHDYWPPEILSGSFWRWKLKIELSIRLKKGERRGWKKGKKIGNCAQDGFLSTSAVGKSWKKKKWVLGPTALMTNPFRENSWHWNQKLESRGLNHMTPGAAGFEEDVSSLLSTLMVILGLYQHILPAFLEVWHFFKQLEITYVLHQNWF